MAQNQATIEELVIKMEDLMHGKRWRAADVAREMECSRAQISKLLAIKTYRQNVENVIEFLENTDGN
jgi:predicted XRE-type DNA-binding protein